MLENDESGLNELRMFCFFKQNSTDKEKRGWGALGAVGRTHSCWFFFYCKLYLVQNAKNWSNVGFQPKRLIQFCKHLYKRNWSWLTSKDIVTGFRQRHKLEAVITSSISSSEAVSMFSRMYLIFSSTATLQTKFFLQISAALDGFTLPRNVLIWLCPFQQNDSAVM